MESNDHTVLIDDEIILSQTHSLPKSAEGYAVDTARDGFSATTCVHPMPNTLTVRAVTSQQEWSRLQPVWNNLLLRSPYPVVYLTYEWLTTWWECIARPDANLNILVVERDGVIVALAPLMKVRERLFGISVRKIQFLSMMREAAQPYTVAGHLDIIAASGENEAVAAVFAFLQEEQHSWDCIQFRPVPDDSVTLAACASPKISQRQKRIVRPVSRNKQLRVRGTWSDYGNTHMRDFKKVMKGIGHADEKGEKARILEYRSLKEIPGGFETLLEIERRSWKWNKGVSINAAVFNNFYERLAETFSEIGIFRLSILEMEGRLVAYNYWLQFGDTVWGMKTSYDSSYRKRSPGKILMYHTVHTAYENKMAAVDFLWGNESIKVSLADSEQSFSELMIFGASLRGKLCRLVLGTSWFRHAILHAHNLKYRMARKLGICIARSELTRIDQLRPHYGESDTSHTTWFSMRKQR